MEQVKLIYLALLDVEMSKQRVAKRVLEGGHDIPQDALERRFSRSLNNLLEHYSARVDFCVCYMNIGVNSGKVFEQALGQPRVIINDSYYQHIVERAQA